MFTVPLYIILFIYFGFLTVFVIFSIFNFYHIVTSGSFTMASFVFTFFIFALTILTLYFTYQLLLAVDWKGPLFTLDLSGFGLQQL